MNERSKPVDFADLARMGKLPTQEEILRKAVPMTKATAPSGHLELVTDDSWVDGLADEGEPPSNARHGGAHINEGENEVPEALPRIDAHGIFAPLPPLPYLVERLDICAGAPILFAGYGFSGKTVAAQQLAIDVSQGAAAWGVFPTKAGRVLHIDYEQGARLTRERYQRLCVASTLGPQDLEGKLSLSCFPPMTMDSKIAEEVLCHELDGHALCIIDSLRAAAPTVDENSSDVRRVLDTLNRVSERTGCAVIVIHHARKPQKDATGGARMAIRGSGAIYDACASVLVFDGQKGAPTVVTHEKARNSGILADDFEIVIDDVAMGGYSRAGVMVAARAFQRPSADPQAVRASKAVLRTREDAEQVANILRAKPGISVRKLNDAAKAHAGLSKERVGAALELLGDAIIRGSGPRNAIPFSLNEDLVPEWLGAPG